MNYSIDWADKDHWRITIGVIIIIDWPAEYFLMIFLELRIS